MLTKVDSYPELVRAAAEAARGVREPVVTGPECLRELQVVFGAMTRAH